MLVPATILNVSELEIVVDPPFAIDVPVVQPVPNPFVTGSVVVLQQRMTVPVLVVEQVFVKADPYVPEAWSQVGAAV